MKKVSKYLCMLLALVMLFGLCACGNTDAKPSARAARTAR